MARRKRVAHIAALSLCAVASCASAQLAPPVLEVDFATATIPLSPALSVAIAIAVALTAAFMLRRTPRGAPWTPWSIVAAVPLACALMHLPIVGQAQARPPAIVLPLTVNPVIVTGLQYFDYVQAINKTGGRITIVAVKYDPGGYDFYLDAATTTSVPGLSLAPGAVCFIRILSLG